MKNKQGNKPYKWNKCKIISKLKCEDSKRRQQESKKKQTKDGTDKLKKNGVDMKNKVLKIGKCKRLLQLNLKRKLMLP